MVDFERVKTAMTGACHFGPKPSKRVEAAIAFPVSPAEPRFADRVF